MADSWHALAQVSAGDGQRYLKRRLLRLFEASRLTHLRPRDVDLSCEGALKVVISLEIRTPEGDAVWDEL